MEGAKGFFESKTVWGGIISLAAFTLTWAGYTISEADKISLANDIVALVGIAGSLLSIYGRVVASKVIRRAK